jgi:small-conductance mechanosensitive channel
VQLFFNAVERGAVKMSGFEPEWATPTYKLVRLAIAALALVVAYPYVPGSDSVAFKGLSVFLGIVLTLSSSTSGSNIIAGYMMIYRCTFRLGDRVKVADILGDVTAMRSQATHLRTPTNEELLIPNSQIINGNVTNFSSLASKGGPG